MLNWDEVMQCKTYAELKAYSEEHAGETTAAENLAIVEHMRQLRYGYEPGTLKMDKTIVQYMSMEEFRAATEREYQEEIEKYGPR